VVLISNLNTGRITKYNSSTGEYIGDFATGIAGPTRMKIGADSLLYVLQWSGNGKVKDMSWTVLLLMNSQARGNTKHWY